MRVPLSWLREYAELPAVSAIEVASALLRVGLEVERVEAVGADVRGIVVGEVRDAVAEPRENGKTIHWCQVEVGDRHGGVRGIVCGAPNVAAGQRVPVALPGAQLPGGFRITERTTYGHLSAGMICSARELGLGDDHSGIYVLDEGAEVGDDVVTLLGLREDVLDIAVTPDRGYCLSIRGVAREAATAFGVPFSDPARGHALGAGGEPESAPGYPVHVEDVAGCDRYVTRSVRGLDPNVPSPRWLTSRLLLAGMRPISLAVDVTNYVLLDLGQPLHAFDRAALSGAISVRRAAPGEALTTLDGVRRPLDPDDLVIADSSGAIALAGVMGGGPTEVGADTTDIVVESAHFAPETIARGGRRHRLSTEASRRFERGVDDALAPAAAEAAVRLLVQLGGATAEPGGTDVDHRPDRPAVTLPVDLPGRIAGRDYPSESVRRRLLDVGCEIGDDGGQPERCTADVSLLVTPPSWRADLRVPVDLVEEVLRLEGYDTLPAVVPTAPAGRGLSIEQRRRRRVGRELAAAGYAEVQSYPFLSPSIWDEFDLAPEDSRRRAVRLANPLSEAAPLLRTTLLPGLLTALTRNVGRGLRDVALSETGLVYLPTPADAPDPPAPAAGARPSDGELAALDASLPSQPRHVAVALTGLREPAGWWGPGRTACWADAVEAARTVAQAAGVTLTVRRGERAPWHPGRCAELVVEERVVGHAGELHPRAVAALDLPARTAAMELDLDALVRDAGETVPAPAVSAFPPVKEDVALVVPAEVPVAAVAQALRDGAGELLESLRLFDVYTGSQVGEGRRSLAFALRMRAPDRTLTVEEASEVRDAAVAAAGARTGAAPRG